MKRYHSIEMNRRDLYEEVWKRPVSEVAKAYSLNYAKLCQTLKEENIPYPSAGYWTKLRLCKDVSNEKQPLPDSDKDTVELILLSFDLVEEDKKRKWAENVLDFLDKEERDRVLRKAETISPAMNTKLYPMIEQYEKTIIEFKKNIENHPWYYGSYNYEKEKKQPPFTLQITDAGREKIIRILNPLFYTLEELGCSIEDVNKIKIHDDTVVINFREKSIAGSDAVNNQIDRIKISFIYGENHSISDTKTKRIEDRLGEIIIALYEQSERNRIEREEREKREAEIERRRKAEEAIIETYKTEARSLQGLLNEIEDYKIACDIRDYVAACRKEYGEAINEEWAKWAEDKADWFDPIIAKEDLIFGNRKHQEPRENKEIDSYARKFSMGYGYYGYRNELPWEQARDERKEFFKMKALLKRKY